MEREESINFDELENLEELEEIDSVDDIEELENLEELEEIESIEIEEIENYKGEEDENKNKKESIAKNKEEGTSMEIIASTEKKEEQENTETESENMEEEEEEELEPTQEFEDISVGVYNSNNGEVEETNTIVIELPCLEVIYNNNTYPLFSKKNFRFDSKTKEKKNKEVLFLNNENLFEKQSIEEFIQQLQEEFSIKNDVILLFPELKLKFYSHMTHSQGITLNHLYVFSENVCKPFRAELIEENVAFIDVFNGLLNNTKKKIRSPVKSSKKKLIKEESTESIIELQNETLSSLSSSSFSSKSLDRIDSGYFGDRDQYYGEEGSDYFDSPESQDDKCVRSSSIVDYDSFKSKLRSSNDKNNDKDNNIKNRDSTNIQKDEIIGKKRSRSSINDGSLNEHESPLKKLAPNKPIQSDLIITV
eukprot:TRINITY_DN1273_c0_g1_i1.p1 TRINITY_DN1273_c0_g1~~TRINITY_DN1273_c0_g1_i1.p1  ORF type:complete len:420 (+),score=109.36 TRINITY_DN1273_c0_g1_i1:74-1333(+)